MAETPPPDRTGEPLTARRPPPPAARDRLRFAVRLVAAVLAIQAALLAAWWGYGHWRLGRIELLNNGPPLTVEVLDETGEFPIGEPIQVDFEGHPGAPRRRLPAARQRRRPAGADLPPGRQPRRDDRGDSFARGGTAAGRPARSAVAVSAPPVRRPASVQRQQYGDRGLARQGRPRLRRPRDDHPPRWENRKGDLGRVPSRRPAQPPARPGSVDPLDPDRARSGFSGGVPY